MNMNNYTIKSQEAVQSAVQLAQEKGQQAIETGHLLRGVIEKGENITNFIFNKVGVNSRNVRIFYCTEDCIKVEGKNDGAHPVVSRSSAPLKKKITEKEDTHLAVADAHHTVNYLTGPRTKTCQFKCQSGV